jgi:hypothetical protein
LGTHRTFSTRGLSTPYYIQPHFFLSSVSNA